MSNSYWAKRKSQRMWEHMQRAEDTADEISKLYLHASRYLNHEIEGIFDKYKAKHKLSTLEAKQLLNSLEDPTSYQEMLNRLKAGVKSDEKEELIKMLEAPAYRNRISRLEKLQSDVDMMMKSIYQQEKDFNTTNYINVAHDAYYKSIYDIQNFTGYGFSFNQLDPITVDKFLHSKWSGTNYSDRIWNNTHALAKDIKEQLLMSMITGKTEKEIALEISNKYSAAAFNSKRLIRTESNYIAEELEALSYEECGAKKYIFLATLDLKTSETCRELDMKTFLLKNREVGVNCPPMHPWCRSTTIIGMNDKVLKGLQRRARDPETGKNYIVFGNTSYKEWFAEQEKKYGADKVSVFQKKVKNLSSDKKQLERYSNVLGKENVPKSIEAFQELKYNDSDKFKVIRTNYNDEIRKEIIRSEKTPKNIHQGKQDKHIKGTANYIEGKSYLTISNDEIQELVNKYAGTGEILRDKKGRWKHQEVINTDKIVGVDIDNRTNDEYETTSFKIHYGKQGVHIVPKRRKD